MFSRAHLVILKELEKLQKDSPWGIEAHPLKEDNLFEWTAKVHGLQDSQWEGGVFRLYLKFDENYNYKPPEVCFHTIPFHPNVDMITGRPCIDFLDNWDMWDTSYSLTVVLLSVQYMLSNPVLENAVNQEAVELIRNSPHAYNQMVQECISASQRVEAGLSPYCEFHTNKLQPEIKTVSKHALPPAYKVMKVSFEDYHDTWRGIATSKSNHSDRNLLLSKLKQTPDLQAQHYGLPLDTLQLQLQKQIEEHNTLMFGKFNSSNLSKDEKQIRLEQVNQMKKIYLQRKTPRRTPLNMWPDNQVHPTKEEEPWENEVDDLVAWTNNLDLETL